VLGARLEGRRVGYPGALRSGLGHWGRLFGARFVAGLLIVLGLLALVVPGVVLAVRYALIDQVVVFEGAGATVARRRSAELVKGRVWRIVLAAVLCMALYLGLVVAIGFVVNVVDPEGGFWLLVASGCVQDVLGEFVACVLLLFYWEARAKPREVAETDPYFRMTPVSG
jgi:hypothetical protein